MLHVELFPLGTDGASAKAGGAGSGGVNSMPYVEHIDDLDDEADDLIGKSFRFKVRVSGKIKKLSNYYVKPRIEYQHYMDDVTEAESKLEKSGTKVKGKVERGYEFNHEHVVTQDPVTERYLDYLKHG